MELLKSLRNTDPVQLKRNLIHCRNVSKYIKGKRDGVLHGDTSALLDWMQKCASPTKDIPLRIFNLETGCMEDEVSESEEECSGGPQPQEECSISTESVNSPHTSVGASHTAPVLPRESQVASGSVETLPGIGDRSIKASGLRDWFQQMTACPPIEPGDHSNPEDHANNHKQYMKLAQEGIELIDTALKQHQMVVKEWNEMQGSVLLQMKENKEEFWAKDYALVRDETKARISAWSENPHLLRNLLPERLPYGAARAIIARRAWRIVQTELVDMVELGEYLEQSEKWKERLEEYKKLDQEIESAEEMIRIFVRRRVKNASKKGKLNVSLLSIPQEIVDQMCMEMRQVETVRLNQFLVALKGFEEATLEVEKEREIMADEKQSGSRSQGTLQRRDSGCANGTRPLHGNEDAGEGVGVVTLATEE
ncbi:hypothetical protein K402DRAFT_1890 [Aulographum hederae CBS 113979]|uniref:Uncharacterized protein n=1 Tax=Aulographum hederae CBS 113979 TaxID=1176131 RepID=A0A6G1HH41_9PEZI|nr:hypothetical protein K402DRAFT_1890 [Aulographum hederae CBS 113979]